MKRHKLNRKLSLQKTTIANLNVGELKVIKGGYLPTEFYGNCYTWFPHAACYTKPDYDCRSIHTQCELQACTTLGDCQGPSITNPSDWSFQLKIRTYPLWIGYWSDSPSPGSLLPPGGGSNFSGRFWASFFAFALFMMMTWTIAPRSVAPVVITSTWL